MAAQGEIGEARVHGGEVRRPSSSSSLVSLLLPLLSSFFPFPITMWCGLSIGVLVDDQ